MLEKMLQLLAISCRHKNTSQPFAAAVAMAPAASAEWEAVGSGPSHYIVCLDCGKKFAYDWKNMRRLD
jgi:hypothetical protein